MSDSAVAMEMPGAPPVPRTSRVPRNVAAFVLLSLLLIGSIVAGACLGATNVSLREFLDAILSVIAPRHFEATPNGLVLLHLRFPRVVLGVLVGATLGVAGAAAQGVFRNPLADPGLIGIGGGAMVTVVALLTLGHKFLTGPVPTLLVPGAAFVGGLACAGAVLLLSRRSAGISATGLILAGVAINALCGALTGLMYAFSTEAQLRSATFWSLGSLGAATWKMLAFVVPPMALAILWLSTRARSLDALQLGDAEALHLGLNVPRTKCLILGVVALGVGAAVSMTGLIGFVGLVVPHLVRLLLGANHRIVLPASGLAGASLLVVADVLSRTVAAPSEVPIGALTALIGAPYFLWLLVRSKDAL